jgi:preprotein translocase subunit YajC
MAVMDSIKNVIPNFSLAGMGTLVVGVILFFVIAVLVGGITVWIVYSRLQKKKFNKKIKIWEKIDGRYRPTKEDLAMEIKVGERGDTCFYLKKLKTYKPRYNIQTGENIYWVAIREDGEWINIGMEDIDLSMREAKVIYTDADFRYAAAGLHKSFEGRFKKDEGFWKKYGQTILSIIYVLIMGVMLFLCLGQFMKVIGSISNVINSLQPVLDKASQILGAVDNVCSNSGVVAA